MSHGRLPLKTYSFKVIVEPDEDRWVAYCPALLEQGASTWGHTEAEAVENIQEVVQLVVDSLRDHNDPLPTEPADAVQVSDEPLVSVTV